MYVIYSLLLVLGFLILLPRFFIDAFRHGKYVAGFGERLGWLTPLSDARRPVIWIHCVSVGETQAARPLVQAIKREYPNYQIAVSTITLTGQTFAREVFKNQATKIFYFPFDWRWIVRRTIKAVHPNAVVVMETELWPNFLRECSAREIPVAIVNGRLSHQSFRRYRLISVFMRQVLRSIKLAIVQTDADSERIRALGMDADKILVCGNMKFDAGSTTGNDPVAAELRQRFQLNRESLLILAASTHSPEEAIVLNSFRQILSSSRLKPRLLIAPRHPERFAEVADLLNVSGLNWVSRSAQPSERDANAQVILLDSIGELQSVYALATIVFVGGSFARTGGHNVIEPAAAGVPVIVGPHTFNFHAIIASFLRAGAIVQLEPLSDSATIVQLTEVTLNLLNDEARRDELGRAALTLVNENRGATERTLKALAPILAPAQSPLKSVNERGAPVS
jgi:3-deoxy-D-manno-octulosonic-acid transferase